MGKRQRATLKDVAKEAGVNFTLVSKFLTRNPQARMTKETQKRIEKAIKKLNYRPSSSARALRNGMSKTIGLLSGDLTNSYRAHVANIALIELRKLGYQMLLALSEGFDDHNAVQSLLARDIDGVIYIGPGIHDWKDLPCPVIATDRNVAGKSTANVDFDDAIKEALKGIEGEVVSLCFDESVWKDSVERVGNILGLKTENHFLPFDVHDRLAKLHSICKKRPQAILINGWHTAEMLTELLDSEGGSYNPKVVMHANCTGPFIGHKRISGAIYPSGTDMVKRTCSALVEIIEGKLSEPAEIKIPSRYIPSDSPEFSNLICRHFKLT